MTFLPIVARELRVAARRRSTYWVRFGAALAVMLLGTWFYSTLGSMSTRQLSQGLFHILTGAALLSALSSGVRATADCLSWEKREGTFGLLFLTDLRAYDIVLGKLAAGSISSLYGVVATLPMMAVPVLLGGITFADFGRMALAIVNSLFFSLAVGIGISAFCRSGRNSAGVTSFLLIFFTALLPVGIWAFDAWASSRGIAVSLERQIKFIPSPAVAYGTAMDVVYRAGAARYWGPMIGIHVLGWLFLALAVVVCPRVWQDRAADGSRLKWRERWQSWLYGRPEVRRVFRGSLLSQNPFFWLASRERMKPAYVWIVLGLIVIAWLFGWYKVGRDWLNSASYFTTAMVVNFVLRVWVAAEATRQFPDDRRSGALELLLSTPLSILEILKGQWLALRRQFLAPFIFVLVVEALFMKASMAEEFAPKDRQVWLALYLGAMLMLVADAVAIYWLGLWLSLKARSAQRAANGTLMRILGLPWLVLALVFVPMAQAAGRSGEEPGWQFFFAWWLLSGLGVDLLFGIWARTKLLTEFRLVASERYDKTRAGRGLFWRKWFRSPPTSPA